MEKVQSIAFRREMVFRTLLSPEGDTLNLIECCA